MTSEYVTHYSDSMNPIVLSTIADDFVKKLTSHYMFPRSNFILCYSGMSGISSATILGLKLQQIGRLAGMVYVRKYNEKSHGVEVERQSFIPTNKFKAVRPLFVDDFICDGDTFARTVKEILCSDLVVLKWSRRNFIAKKWWCVLFEPEMIQEKYVGESG